MNLNKLSEKQGNRVNSRLEESLDFLEESIKSKQEMMAKLNKELEEEIKMKNNLLMIQGALFEEEDE